MKKIKKSPKGWYKLTKTLERDMQRPKESCNNYRKAHHLPLRRKMNNHWKKLKKYK